MLNEVKHLVLRTYGFSLPGTRFFVATLLKNDIARKPVISSEPWNGDREIPVMLLVRAPSLEMS